MCVLPAAFLMWSCSSGTVSVAAVPTVLTVVNSTAVSREVRVGSDACESFGAVVPALGIAVLPCRPETYFECDGRPCANQAPTVVVPPGGEVSVPWDGEFCATRAGRCEPVPGTALQVVFSVCDVAGGACGVSDGVRRSDSSAMIVLRETTTSCDVAGAMRAGLVSLSVVGAMSDCGQPTLHLCEAGLSTLEHRAGCDVVVRRSPAGYSVDVRGRPRLGRPGAWYVSVGSDGVLWTDVASSGSWESIAPGVAAYATLRDASRVDVQLWNSRSVEVALELVALHVVSDQGEVDHVGLTLEIGSDAFGTLSHEILLEVLPLLQNAVAAGLPLTVDLAVGGDPRSLHRLSVTAF